MKKTYKRVPFDIELAKKIQAGEIEGRILMKPYKSEEAYPVIILTCDAVHNRKIKGSIDIVVLVQFEDGDVAIQFNSDGYGLDVHGNDVRLLIELQEEAPKQDSFNKKLHDTAEVLATPKHEFKVGDKVVYAGIMGYITNINKNLLVDIDPVICRIFHNVNISEIKFIDDSSTDKPKYDFKPFDRVLVRDNEKQVWLPRLFDSHVEQADFWTQDGKSWKMCIPYEGHEYLVGTTNNPE